MIEPQQSNEQATKERIITRNYLQFSTIFCTKTKNRQQEAKAVAQETLDTTNEDQEAPKTSRGKTIERKQVIRTELRVNIPLLADIKRHSKWNKIFTVNTLHISAISFNTNIVMTQTCDYPTDDN